MRVCDKNIYKIIKVSKIFHSHAESFLIIELLALATRLEWSKNFLFNRLNAVDADMRKSEGPPQKNIHKKSS